MSSLITLPEIKDFLSLKTANTEEDGRLSNIAVQVSSLISSYCGRSFSANTYTEYFNGGVSSVFITNPPLNRVDEVSHFDGLQYYTLGNPDPNGQPIAVEGQAHTISRTGNPILKTRVKKFGRSSVYFDGSSYIQTDSNEDWDLGPDDFSIECYARFANTTSGYHTIVSSGSASNNWSLGINFSSFGLHFSVVENGVTVSNVVQGSNTGYSPNQFYHLSVSRFDNNFYITREGSVIGSNVSSISIPNYGTGVSIGKYMTGYLDSLKISHEGKYSTSYTTSNYPLAADSTTKLLLKFDGSNNTQDFTDLSRTVNQFSFYPNTGEITFDTGDGGGTPELGFFRPLKFKNYPNGVKVIYNGGYTAIPDDLKLAVLEMVKVIYKGKSGSESVRFQGEAIQSHKLSIDDFPPQVRRVLNMYRIIN